MAVRKNTNKSHAEGFVETLSTNGKNALRVILSHEHGAADLRHALGIGKHPQISEAARRTGLAHAGRTIELFHGHARPHAQNIPAHAYGVSKEA